MTELRKLGFKKTKFIGIEMRTIEHPLLGKVHFIVTLPLKKGYANLEIQINQEVCTPIKDIKKILEVFL